LTRDRPPAEGPYSDHPSDSPDRLKARMYMEPLTGLEPTRSVRYKHGNP